VPLIDRALRALELRGVQPQMGLLKSTMLQLDPRFTERDYGTSSFSTFVEKLVDQGFLAVKTVDGHYVVERRGEGPELEAAVGASREDAMKVLRDVLSVNGELLAMGIPAREIRALVQAADSTFKETDYGFSEFAEILNLAGDKGIVRIEADAHHGFRYYPGPEMPHPARSASAVPMVESRAAIARPAVAEARPELQALGNGGRGKGRRRRRRRPESSAGRPIQESPAAYGESALTPAPPAAGETGGDADPSESASVEPASESASRPVQRSSTRRRRGSRRASSRAPGTNTVPAQLDLPRE
jgi:hypothetical protein